jgi:predicted Zn-dependent protease
MMKLINLILLFVLALPSFAFAVDACVDAVDVYIIPLEDFPEDIAADMAKKLSEDLKLHIKPTLKMGSLNLTKLPYSDQFNSDEILEKSQSVIKRLPELTNDTYTVLLTTNDINSPSFSFRFMFATHNTEARTSVISLARMMTYVDNKPIFDNSAQIRLYKMVKRSIGEMFLGWKRTVNIKDIMYSPIMGLQDLDDIGIDHLDETVPKPRCQAFLNRPLNVLSQR